MNYNSLKQKTYKLIESYLYSKNNIKKLFGIGNRKGKHLVWTIT